MFTLYQIAFVRRNHMPFFQTHFSWVFCQRATVPYVNVLYHLVWDSASRRFKRVMSTGNPPDRHTIVFYGVSPIRFSANNGFSVNNCLLVFAISLFLCNKPFQYNVDITQQFVPFHLLYKLYSHCFHLISKWRAILRYLREGLWEVNGVEASQVYYELLHNRNCDASIGRFSTFSRTHLGFRRLL